MGQQPSKGELVYRQVSCGNTEGIKALCRDGASLEWVDREGKTPLMLASLNPHLFNVAKTLIELGADVNAYRLGRNGGNPLHYAAKSGLENTVKLLLSHGANPLVMNDDCQTPLELARAKGYANVVRAIEGHICLFSGWMREFYGPGFLEVLAPQFVTGFLEVLAPQFVTRRVWVVVLPTGARNPIKPFKLELAIYSSIEDARPRTVVGLWKANLEEPKFYQADPSVTIVESLTTPRGRRQRRARCRSRTARQTRIKLAPANENDKQQLQWFCDACKGIPQARHPPTFLHNSQTPIVQADAPSSSTEDLELAMAISASIQSAIAETPIFCPQSSSEASTSSTWNNSVNAGSQGAFGGPVVPSAKAATGKCIVHESGPSGSSTQDAEIQAVHASTCAPEAVPSAPLLVDDTVDDGTIHYPTIESTPVDFSSPPVENLRPTTIEKKEDEGSSSCVVCLDAPVEGACVPCGHMAGCMSCLKEIKDKKWGCPVCRAKIDQVIRVYTV